jgi:hypothetical protein
MAHSTLAGAPRIAIAAEYLSEDEPLDILLLRHLKAPANSHQRARQRQRYVDIDS